MGPGIAEVSAETMRHPLPQDDGQAVVCGKSIVVNQADLTKCWIRTMQLGKGGRRSRLVWIEALVEVNRARAKVLEFKAGVAPYLMTEIDVPLIHPSCRQVVVYRKGRVRARWIARPGHRRGDIWLVQRKGRSRSK